MYTKTKLIIVDIEIKKSKHKYIIDLEILLSMLKSFNESGTITKDSIPEDATHSHWWFICIQLAPEIFNEFEKNKKSICKFALELSNAEEFFLEDKQEESFNWTPLENYKWRNI